MVVLVEVVAAVVVDDELDEDGESKSNAFMLFDEGEVDWLIRLAMVLDDEDEDVVDEVDEEDGDCKLLAKMFSVFLIGVLELVI